MRPPRGSPGDALSAWPSWRPAEKRIASSADEGQSLDLLPGKLQRSEGQPKHSYVAINEAYDYAGDTYDFYDSVFQRNSLDDNGMSLISSVHLAEEDDQGNFVPMNNAFWNGEQMAYGDGDDQIFQRFTGAIEVVGHELTHGVQSFTSNLTYYGNQAPLNEHFATSLGFSSGREER
jgi:Zn-dependent metalloprotease